MDDIESAQLRCPCIGGPISPQDGEQAKTVNNWEWPCSQMSQSVQQGSPELIGMPCAKKYDICVDAALTSVADGPSACPCLRRPLTLSSLGSLAELPDHVVT
jgi:hypothetical protein